MNKSIEIFPSTLSFLKLYKKFDNMEFSQTKKKKINKANYKLKAIKFLFMGNR